MSNSGCFIAQVGIQSIAANILSIEKAPCLDSDLGSDSKQYSLLQTSSIPNPSPSMDLGDAFPEQSLGGETKVATNQFLTPCHVISVFSGSGFSSQVKSVNLSLTYGGKKYREHFFQSY